MFNRIVSSLVLALCTFAQVPAPSPAKWEADIRAFEAMDKTNPPPVSATLFVGSSSIRFWTNLAETFPEWKTIRRGFGGSHISDVNAYFDRLVTVYKPARIILYAGENDIAAGRSPEDVFQEFANFVVKVRRVLPNTRVYYLSMKPSPSRWYLWPQIEEGNRLIKGYAARRLHVKYIDVGSCLMRSGQPNEALFQNDRLHLNQKGYQLWANEIRGVVKH